MLGTNGIVYHAKWNHSDVAVKQLKIDLTVEEDEDFEREVLLLSSLRHPSIVSFYGVSVTSSGKFMIVEYLEKGSLDKVIYNSKMGKERLTLKMKLEILLGISKGMTYLHSIKPNMIIHRDLKPGNILLDKNMNSKVCDFGLSKVIGSVAGSMTANIGTLYYIAPEVLADKQVSGLESKLDVYSFGIIMWEILFEEVPFHSGSDKGRSNLDFSFGENESSSLYAIPLRVVSGMRPRIPFNTSKERREWLMDYLTLKKEQKDYDLNELDHFIESYIELMKQCWDGDAKQRPTFHTITQSISTLLDQLY